MKRVFGVFWVLAGMAITLSGCVSVMMGFAMDGLVPIEYPQSVAQEDERLIYFAPWFTENSRFSNLYIITNPESLYDAQYQLANGVTLPLKTIENTLKEFSAVKIQSSMESTDPRFEGFGIGIFHLPADIDKFFYVYIGYQNDVKYGFDYSTEVFSGIVPFPPGEDDVYMGFYPNADGMINMWVETSPADIKKRYDDTTGVYGQHLAKEQPHIGFIEIGFDERMRFAKQLQKEKAFREGSTLHITSHSFTLREEKRLVKNPGFIYVGRDPSITHWVRGGNDIIIAQGPSETEEITYVRVHNELAFELYQGTTLVYKGRTPVDVTGLAHDKEYTLRWVSPVSGNSEFRFTTGLDFSGYPDNEFKSIN